MKKLLAKIVLIGLVATMSFEASAHRNGKVHRHAKKVIVAPSHHHGYPVATLAAVVGLAVVIDAAGNAKTESGQTVVVLDSEHMSDGQTEVVEKDNIVYLIK